MNGGTIGAVSRFIVQVGVPSAIAIGLVYVLAGELRATVRDLKVQISQGIIEQGRQGTQLGEILGQARTTNRFLFARCFSRAKTQDDIQFCFEEPTAVPPSEGGRR